MKKINLILSDNIPALLSDRTAALVVAENIKQEKAKLCILLNEQENSRPRWSSFTEYQQIADSLKSIDADIKHTKEEITKLNRIAYILNANIYEIDKNIFVDLVKTNTAAFVKTPLRYQAMQNVLNNCLPFKVIMSGHYYRIIDNLLSYESDNDYIPTYIKEETPTPEEIDKLAVHDFIYNYITLCSIYDNFIENIKACNSKIETLEKEIEACYHKFSDYIGFYNLYVHYATLNKIIIKY